MALVILRCFFVLVAAGVGVQLIQEDSLPREPYVPWLVIGGMVLLAGLVIGIDVFTGRKRLDTITAVYFGLVIGLFLTYVLKIAMSPVFTPDRPLMTWAPLILGMVLCYTCISLLMQTKNDFRFIIPYVEFSKEVKGRRPYILDTSVVIDGRIADVVETHVFDSQLIMPRFAITELQARLGDYFARAQGGSAFTSSAVAAVLAGLDAAGAHGIGQSSWGPTGFALAPSAEEAERLAKVAKEHPAAGGLDIRICSGLNRGAAIVAQMQR